MKKIALLMIMASLTVWTCSSKPEHPGASAETCDATTCVNPEHHHATKGAKTCDPTTCVNPEHHHATKGVGQEHAGKEHGGSALGKQEHAGQEHAGQEHAGQEHGGTAAQTYTAAEIKGAMNAHIAMREENGIFKIKDDKTGEDLQLKFVKIHDPVRKIEGKGFFACTDFEVVGEPGKLYDLDFWLNPEDGVLKVTQEKIHKNPVKTETGWEKKARYTFINDNPVEIK